MYAPFGKSGSWLQLGKPLAFRDNQAVVPPLKLLSLKEVVILNFSSGTRNLEKEAPYGRHSAP